MGIDNRKLGFWKSLRKLQHANIQQREKAVYYANLYLSRIDMLHFLQMLYARRHLLYRLTGTVQKIPSGIRQVDFLPDAVEQCHAEFLFQLLDAWRLL